MLNTIKQFINDLRLPSHYVRHQNARKQAFLLLGLLVSVASGMWMYYQAATLVNIVLGTSLSFIATSAMLLLSFTDMREGLAKWWDDKIHPPVSIIIPMPDKDLAKTQKRQDLITELTKPENKVSANQIKKLKENLQALFALRSYATVSNADLDKLKRQFDAKNENLLKNIKDPNDWEKPKVIAQLNQLIIEAIIYSDTLLACMEKEMREHKNPVSSENVSKMLINQSKRYCRDFMYSGVIDLYHQARSHIHVQDEFAYFPTDKRFNNKFYELGTSEYVLRKVYNTFIKHGFYQRYGNKAFNKALTKDDDRFCADKWTQKDSKKSRTFSPYPGTRPT